MNDSFFREVYYYPLSTFQVMIGFGVKVLDGTPQDEKVITLTGLTGAGLFTSGYVSIVIGPILLVASGKLFFRFDRQNKTKFRK